MRRTALVATLILPFAFAALPLISLFAGRHESARDGTLAVTPATVAATTLTLDTTDTTLAYGVSQPAADPCA